MLLRLFSIAILSFVFFEIETIAQADLPIELTNPNFEDMPRHSRAPRGWYDCGNPFETPPDVHPTPDASFSVSKVASSGETYLGMVVRDNDTHEGVGQRLQQPLQGGKCYEFSLSLSRSELYVSMSRQTEEEVNYTTPAKVRIWGGNNYCRKSEMLAESSSVINTRWLEYNFRFEPTASHEFIMIEAFYVTPVLFPYNGHVLVDNASAIVPIPCDDPQELAIEEPRPAEEPTTSAITPPQNINVSPSQGQSSNNTVTTRPKPKPTPPAETRPNTTPPKTRPAEEEETTLAGVKRKDLTTGQKIQIEKLYFSADQSQINSKSYEALNDLYKFLNRNKDVIIEVGGHTNSTPPDEYCDRLSTARAKEVVDYLISKGIDRNRLQYKGYGKRNPIASNKTEVGRKRNQRVEVKVLSFNG